MSRDKCLLLSVRSDYGGGPEHILSLLRGLRGRYFFVMAAPAGQAYSTRFADHAEFEELPFRSFSVLAFWRLAKVIRREKIALIHSHGKGAGVYGRLLGLVTGRPVVHTFHGFHYRHLRGAKRFLYLAVERWLAKRSAALLNVSASERETCVEAGILDGTNSIVVPNGVVVPAYQRAAIVDGASCEWVLINVARHEPEKGVDGVLRLARALSGLGLSYQLWLVGDGEQRAELEDLANSYGIKERVRFLGFRDDVASLMQAADIFVSASHGEGMPLTVLEAMAAGLPSVVSDVVGNCDVVEPGRTGFLYPLNQPEVGAKAVGRLMADAGLYNRCSLASHEIARAAYSVEVMCERVAEIYEQVLTKTKQGET